MCRRKKYRFPKSVKKTRRFQNKTKKKYPNPNLRLKTNHQENEENVLQKSEEYNKFPGSLIRRLLKNNQKKCLLFDR